MTLLADSLPTTPRATSAGIVASAFPAASEAGAEMLWRGGNAVDAAVAAAWALAVCEPSASGLGGHTVLMVHREPGPPIVIRGPVRAPASAAGRAVPRRDRHAGFRAATVPTTPATLEAALAAHGRLPLATVLEPAIRLAADGYQITRLQSRQLRWCRRTLAATEGASRFLRDGRAYQPGERFRQPRLAEALTRIERHGVGDFYEGAIAAAIVEDMERHGGLITADDLRCLPAPAAEPALTIAYRGHLVACPAPPGGGPQLLFALRLLEELGPPDPLDDPDGWRARLALATFATFREREAMARASSDPAAGGHDLDRERARAVARRLGAGASVRPGIDAEEPGDTTHLCAMDSDGLTVSLTQSIQSLFGAKVANERYGFVYNNYLTTVPRRSARSLGLGSDGVIRSNAAPTVIVAPGNERVVALGAAGSRRIVSSLLTCISGMLDAGLDPAEAVAAPRVHARLSGRVWVERPAATPTLVSALADEGFIVEQRARLSYAMGSVQAVARTASTMDGAADPRRDGSLCRR